MWHAVLLFVLTTLLNAAHANDFKAEVKHAETNVQHGEYVLVADLDYHLSPQAQEALENGVPLFWRIEVKLQKQRDYFWNKTELKQILRYRLHYHALLNMYRVRNENTGAVNSFSTLSAALNNMGTIRDFLLISTKNLTSQTLYAVAIKVYFEDGELPLPLQTQVIANPQWQLSSEWTLWNLSN